MPVDKATLRRRATARRRAQRRFSNVHLMKCSTCGQPVGKHPLHHPDIDGAPDLVVVLCDRCHRVADIELGRRKVMYVEPKGPATKLTRLI